MMENWETIAGLFLTLISMIFAGAWWFVAWAEKRDADQEEHFNQQIQTQTEEIAKIHDRIDKHVDELTETREQLHKNYVKHSEIEVLRKEIRDDFKGVFQRMGGIDRAVNQLIGVIQGKFKND